MRANERLDYWALLPAQYKAQEQYAQSASGMRAKAIELRHTAAAMGDSNDRDLILRLAAGFEQRVDNASRGAKRGR
ncbi:MAG TPA: hypothetical protein VG328_07955 [Stellaceae bacterium]|jgi:hypothetical protein|nr:hypothetical protein [Stellaceae bacterium]